VKKNVVYLFLVLVLSSCSNYKERISETITVKVIDKYTVTRSNTDHDGRTTVRTVRMVDTDKETFENIDSLLFWKMNSADVYRKIRVGETYTFLVAGYRNEALSLFRNIITVKEVRNE
jgi:hypothetical protein